MRGFRRSIPLRGLIVALCVQALALSAWSGRANAEDLMLTEESHSFSKGWAWMWFGLSAVSFAVAANDYEQIQPNINKAKAAYAKYQAATTAADALAWRDQTTASSSRAVAYESSTNVALGLGVIFAAAAFAMFHYTGKDEGADSAPMLLSERGIELRLRF